MKRLSLIEITQNNEILLNFLQSFGFNIVKNCYKCGNEMFLDLKNLNFRCQKKYNDIRCNVKVSYFGEESLFHKSQLTIGKQLMIIYMYSISTKINDVAYEYEIVKPQSQEYIQN